MNDSSWTWVAIAIAVGALAAITAFVWALGAPGRKRPDREPEDEKRVPPSARENHDPRQAVTPLHDRHDVEHRADGLEIERDIIKDMGMKPKDFGLENTGLESNPKVAGPDIPETRGPSNNA